MRPAATVSVRIGGYGDVDDERRLVEYGDARLVVSDAVHLELVRLSVGQCADRVDDALTVLGADAERRVRRRVRVVGKQRERRLRHGLVVLVVDDQSHEVLAGRDAARQRH